MYREQNKKNTPYQSTQSFKFFLRACVRVRVCVYTRDVN